MRMLGFLRREQGSALLIALGTMTVFAIVGTTLTYYTTRNAASADISKGDGYSFSFAEAGLHNALAVLSNPANDPTEPTLLSTTATSNYNGNRAEWSGTYNDTLDRWDITSTGYVANPSGANAAELKRTLTAKVPIYPKQTQPLAFDSWNYVYSWGTDAACDMTMDSSIDISTRVMVAGDLCMLSSSQLSGSTTEVLVGGQIKTYSSAHVGQTGSPIARADVAGGCRYENGTLHNPCTTADKVWATTVTSAPELEPAPTVDLNGWYKKASPGPYHPCEVTSGTPPVFDNDQGASYDPTRRNRSVPTDFDLTKSSSYTCRTTLNGQTFGELSWNNTTKVLTIAGTIFIDGDAYASQSGTYSGQATLYLSGSFKLDGSVKLCAVALGGAGSDCNYSSGAWTPNTRLFTIVVNGGGGQSNLAGDVSGGILGSSMWQGAMYGGAGTRIMVDGSARFSGPLISDEVDLNSSVQAESFGMISTAPSGMPGNSTVNAQPDKPQLFSG
jgi:Tfp pilus assembly protein PilX